MLNTEWFSIRTLTLPATAIALLAAFFVVWFVLRMQFSKQWSGVYADAIFTFIIVLKFSLIVTDFKAVLAQPLALLYFNGGTFGVYLATITVLLQLLWKRHKLQWADEGVMASVWAIILTQSIYQWFVVLLNDNSMNSEVITLTVLSILTLFILWKITALQKALIIYTAGYLIVATLQPQGLWQPAVGVSVLLLMLGLGIQRVGGKKMKKNIGLLVVVLLVVAMIGTYVRQQIDKDREIDAASLGKETEQREIGLKKRGYTT